MRFVPGFLAVLDTLAVPVARPVAAVLLTRAVHPHRVALVTLEVAAALAVTLALLTPLDARHTLPLLQCDGGGKR